MGIGETPTVDGPKDAFTDNAKKLAKLKGDFDPDTGDLAAYKAEKAKLTAENEAYGKTQEEAKTINEFSDDRAEAEKINTSLDVARAQAAEAVRLKAEAEARAEQAQKDQAVQEQTLAEADALAKRIISGDLGSGQETSIGVKSASVEGGTEGKPAEASREIPADDEATAISTMVELSRLARRGDQRAEEAYKAAWTALPENIRKADGFKGKVEAAVKEDGEKEKALAYEEAKTENDTRGIEAKAEAVARLEQAEKDLSENQESGWQGIYGMNQEELAALWKSEGYTDEKLETNDPEWKKKFDKFQGQRKKYEITEMKLFDRVLSGKANGEEVKLAIDKAVENAKTFSLAGFHSAVPKAWYSDDRLAEAMASTSLNNKQAVESVRKYYTKERLRKQVVKIGEDGWPHVYEPRGGI
ncbi:MAG: hypothetical protein Q8Q10_00210 [bacterium]|nr:hypothetical protein [bacterium]